MNTNETKKQNRIVYYDAIKVLGIYLVCIYHYNNFNSNIIENHNLEVYINYFFEGISTMGVPLFFMVNGSLLLNKSYNFNNHLTKILYLYSFFFLWSFISLVIFIPLGHSYSLKSFIIAVFYLEQDTNNHLWFLQALVSIYLLFPIIKQLYDSPQKNLLYWFSFLVFLFSFGNHFLNALVNFLEFISGLNYLKGDSLIFFPNINPFGDYSYCFFYFIIGGILSKRLSENKINPSNKLLIISFFMAWVLLFLYGIMMTISDNILYEIVWYGYYSIMTLIMSISTFILFAKINYSNKKINNYLMLMGSNTFGIYLIHRFVGAITIPHFQGLLLARSLPLNILYGFFVMLISLLIVLIIKQVPLLRKTVEL
jgi:surface polysaccharide O-acyltransferase-like enzyme